MKFYDLWKVLDSGEQHIILKNGNGEVLDGSKSKFGLTKKYDESEIKNIEVGNITIVDLEV